MKTKQILSLTSLILGVSAALPAFAQDTQRFTKWTCHFEYNRPNMFTARAMHIEEAKAAALELCRSALPNATPSCDERAANYEAWYCKSEFIIEF